MKKKTLFLAFILLLSITALILSSCTSNTSPLTSSQPPVTITSIQPPVTMTATQPPVIITSTQPPVTINVTQTMTVTATQTVVPSPLPATDSDTDNKSDVSQIMAKNNPHFLVGRDTFLDMDLLGFYTQNDATFLPKIPTIKDIDEWILNFNFQLVKYPIIVNWGYITKSGKPDTTFAFKIWRSDLFKTLYSTNQTLLINSKSPITDLYVSPDGIHVQNIKEEHVFSAHIYTQNSDDILGWWMKLGETFPN